MIVVNNGDEGLELAELSPSVQVVRPGANVGFAAGCNLGADRRRGEVLLFLNPDTVIKDDAMAELARTVSEPDVGAAMGRPLLLSDPKTLNSRGAVIHITGLGWSSGLGEPARRSGRAQRDHLREWLRSRDAP